MYRPRPIAAYYTFEWPVSGMSMNPARTLASAAGARSFESLWIYFTAPLLGMMLAAEIHLRLRGGALVRCAKLHHQNDQRCIFRCAWPARERADGIARSPAPTVNRASNGAARVDAPTVASK
jgi:aquaporin Z